jgi:hypothetical protein
MRQKYRVIGEGNVIPVSGYFVTPIAFAVDKISDVTREVFGPVLHVVRFDGDRMNELLDDINAQRAGPAVILSFVIAGLICICAALAYAELATMMPTSGSSYTYSYATMGEPVAWMVS